MALCARSLPFFQNYSPFPEGRRRAAKSPQGELACLHPGGCTREGVEAGLGGWVRSGQIFFNWHVSAKDLQPLPEAECHF